MAMLSYIVAFGMTTCYGIDVGRLAVGGVVAALALTIYLWPARDRTDRLPGIVATALTTALCLDIWSTCAIDHAGVSGTATGAVRVLAWFLTVAGIHALPLRTMSPTAD